MKSIEELLRNLARPEVLEFALASDRLPCVKVGASFQPVDGSAPSTDTIVRMLADAGAKYRLDALSSSPTEWAFDVKDLGTVSASVVLRGEVLQARFTLAKREIVARELPDSIDFRKASATSRAPDKSADDDDDDDEPTMINGRSRAEIAADPPSLEFEDTSTGDALREAARAADAPSESRAAVSAMESTQRPPTPEDEDREAEEAASSTATSVRRPTPLPPVSNSVTERDLASAARRALESMPNGARTSEEDSGVLELARILPSGSANATAAERMEFDGLIARARAEGASDLHILAARRALLRIDGTLSPRGEPIEASRVEKILRSITPMRASSVLDFEGDCAFAYAHPAHGRFRVNVMREAAGLKASLHAIARDIPTIASLDVPSALADSVLHRSGIVIIAGPSGSGKTSTLAALVGRINEETRSHILIFEHTIEFVHPVKRSIVSQREISTHTRTLVGALKAAKHEDADVVVLADVRDAEMARAAIVACERGQLVLLTIDAKNVARAIEKLLLLLPHVEYARGRAVLANGLRFAASQRLVLAQGGGRVAAFELLPASNAIATAIRDGAAIQASRLRRRDAGAVRLDDALAELVRSGRATESDAKLNAESPEDFDALVRGKKEEATDEVMSAEFESALDLSGLLSRPDAMFAESAASAKKER